MGSSASPISARADNNFRNRLHTLRQWEPPSDEAVIVHCGRESVLSNIRSYACYRAKQFHLTGLDPGC